MPSISVLIADGHQPFRRGLRQLCEHGGFKVVGEAKNGHEVVVLAQSLQPDVILVDVEMPILDGVQATRLITAQNQATRVIALTVHPDSEHVFQAIKAGAYGYLLKNMEEDVLVKAVQAVYRGEALIGPRMTARVLDEFRRINRTDAKISG